MTLRGAFLALLVTACACVAPARAQEMNPAPTAAPSPSGPPVTLHLEIQNTTLHVGDFLALRVSALNHLPHALIGFMPVRTIRVSTWPRGWRDQSIVDDDFIASVVTLLPAGSAYLWGSGSSFWSAHVLQITWDPGEYHVRYCTPVFATSVCSNAVAISVDE